MSDRSLVLEILSQIGKAAERISRRVSVIDSADAFMDSEEGLEKLDAICMQLIAVGESLKNLDKVTDQKLLAQYPQVDWKGAKGIRDIITHHYFDLDAEAVYNVCESNIPVLIETIQLIKADVEQSTNEH